MLASATVLLLLIGTVAFILVQGSTTGSSSPASEDEKAIWCSSFTVADADDCSDLQWEGILKDMFSPDDTCPNSTRYIDARQGDGNSIALEISASGTDDNCNSTWGRRFDPTTTVNPVISRITGAGPCVRSTSFVSKVPPDDPLYADAQAGALNFTLKLGTVNGTKVNMWNGVYNGQGGDMNGQYSPPSDCDNFWRYL